MSFELVLSCFELKKVVEPGQNPTKREILQEGRYIHNENSVAQLKSCCGLELFEVLFGWAIM